VTGARAGVWLLRAPDVRFLIFAALGLIAAMAAALVVFDARVEATHNQEEERAARRELALLDDIYAEKGEAGVRDSVLRRGRLADQSAIFALREAHGAILGSVAKWPDVQWDDGAWGELTLQLAGAAPQTAAALIALMPDGSVALIGNDLSAREHVRRAAIVGFSVALVVVTALALAAGIVLNNRARRRIAAITHTAEEVMAGRLHARVPAGRARSGDVFDHLGDVVNAMLDRLEALFAAMRAVTDSLAHDLRTPLNRLKSALERAALAGNGAALAEIEHAQGEADRLAATFAALIDIARAESGLSEEAMEIVDLKALAEGLADLFGPSAEDRGQSIALTAPNLSLRAHRPLLSQAIGNLIDNAIKYAPPGGAIRLALRETEDGAEIIVEDEGGGIPEPDRLRVRERFVRLRPTEAGAGLGLSIAAATARLHKGELRLEDNEPGLRAVLTLRTRA
jgi:signal transduction histidine kinase